VSLQEESFASELRQTRPRACVSDREVLHAAGGADAFGLAEGKEPAAMFRRLFGGAAVIAPC